MRIHGISSMATRDVLADAVEAWHRQGGEDVVFESVGGVEAARRIRDGEAFDVAVLATDAIAALVEAGRIAGASVVSIARSEVAIAVPRGAARPRIDSEAALRGAVLAARAPSYSSGPSGRALRRLFERWGIAEELRTRVLQPAPGMPVGALLADGRADLGFQQLSELMHLDGVDVIGPMPPGLEIVTTFAGGVCIAATHALSAQRLLRFFQSPAAGEAKRRHGMMPA